jgi:membrane fusion protein
VVAYGERRDLRAGMVLRADLPIDRRRLWQQLFDPLLAVEKRNRG